METVILFDEINDKVLRLMADDPLKKPVERPHITVQRNPEIIPRHLFGTPVIVEITGYGNDGENEGLSCRVQSVKPELQELLDKIFIPHITLSTKENAKPLNTRYLEFKEFSTPYVCKGFFGGM